MKRLLRTAFAFALTAAFTLAPAQALKGTFTPSPSSGGVVLLSDDDHCHGC